MSINKALPTSFKLVFPLLPKTETVEEQKEFTIYITKTILPSITINAIEIPWQGGKVYGEGGGIEYGSWTTSFIIDDKWENYQLIYNWITDIYNGIDVFGRDDFNYQVDASLIILDNYEKPITNFKFIKIWPSMLGEVSLSYQDNESYLSTDVTFSYDYFYKE